MHLAVVLMVAALLLRADLHCFFDTMVGNTTLKVPAMPPANIVKPFVASFASDDPTKGGCPTIPI